MNPYIYILDPHEILDITIRLHQLQAAADQGQDVFWNRDGYVRVIPNAILVQSLQTYGDWRLNQENFGSVMPYDASVLRWEQTIQSSTAS